MKKYFILMLVLLLMSAVFVTACSSPEVVPPDPDPDPDPQTEEPAMPGDDMNFPATIYGSTSALESAVTVVFAGVEPEFERILGSRLRFVNVDLIMSQAVVIKEGKAQFWNTHLGSAIRAIYGMEEFASEQWDGPQRIRLVWRGGPIFLSMIARESSGMTTVADLKGKRVATYPGGEGFISACLAHAGLTLDDVVVVPTSAFNDALRAVLENRADSAFASGGGTVVQEISASPGGLIYLSIPHNDTEGWKRLQMVNPSLLPMTPPVGWGGAEEAWEVEQLGFPNGQFAYDHADETVIYGIAKVLAEGYDSFKNRHAQLEFWTLETGLDLLGLPVPLHSGTVRYFKDRGLWTNEMEEWQERQLERENQRIVAWLAATASAKSKGIKIEIGNAEWQAYWKSYLDAIE